MDLPIETREIVRKALNAGQTEVAGEVIGNYLKNMTEKKRGDLKK